MPAVRRYGGYYPPAGGRASYGRARMTLDAGDIEALRAELAQAREELAQIRAAKLTLSTDVSPTGQLVLHLVTPWDRRGELSMETKARSLNVALAILRGQGFTQVTAAPGDGSGEASPSGAAEVATGSS
jgi:hypothetical protein